MTSQDRSQEQENDKLLDEAELLIWALLDDNITEQQTTTLEEMVRTSEPVRRRYLECVELHTNLAELFAPPKAPTIPVNLETPVLGSLGDIHQTQPNVRPPITD